MKNTHGGANRGQGRKKSQFPIMKEIAIRFATMAEYEQYMAGTTTRTRATIVLDYLKDEELK